jgi:glutathione S-transferase
MRNPEDLIAGPGCPDPKPEMLQPYEPAEKQRRIMGHDLENNLPFFAVGLLYVVLQAGPSSSLPLYVYTASKLLHHSVYWTGQRHEVRATIWTITNGSFLWMCKLVFDQLW